MWGRKKYSLEIKQFTAPNFNKNEYLIINGREAAAIDVNEASEDVSRILDDNGIRLKYIFVTHAHPSHIQALPILKQNAGGKFCLHEFDHDLLAESGTRIEPDLFVKDNMKLMLGDLPLKVLHTPGHTKGSLCFWSEKTGALFSGSTLLNKGYGQIWGNSSMSLMLFSLKRLNYTVSSDTIIYPRSGEVTTMGKEAWLNCLRSH